MNDLKSEVKDKIKKYSNKEYLSKYIENEFLTEDGSANITLKLKDGLFDSRTVGNQLDIDKSIYEFIDDKSSMLSNDIRLNLHITNCNLDNDEKGKAKHIIKEHYAIELYKIQKSYKRVQKQIIILLMLGLLFFIIYSLIAYNTKSKLFIEVFGFLFSFTLWQAFEYLIYDLSKIKRDRESIVQKLLMDIDFE